MREQKRLSAVSAEVKDFPGKVLIFDAEIVFTSKPTVTGGIN